MKIVIPTKGRADVIGGIPLIVPDHVAVHLALPEEGGSRPSCHVDASTLGPGAQGRLDGIAVDSGAHDLMCPAVDGQACPPGITNGRHVATVP